MKNFKIGIVVFVLALLFLPITALEAKKEQNGVQTGVTTTKTPEPDEGKQIQSQTQTSNQGENQQNAVYKHSKIQTNLHNYY